MFTDIKLYVISSHYPTTKFTVVSDTPENLRLAKQSKQQSQVGKIAYLFVCMVNTIYLFSFVETPRKFIIAELSIRKLGS